MLDILRNKLGERLVERARHQAALDEVIAAAEAEQRDLSDEESERFAEAKAEIDRIDVDIEDLEARIAELEDLESRRRAAPRVPTVRVTAEEPVYRPDGHASFFVDAWRARHGDYAAEDRIRRHAAQMAEHRDIGTPAVGGLVVPQYLVDEFAPVLRNGRAFANAIRRLPLPEQGISFVIPRGQTGSSVAAQSAENAAVSETDMANADLTVSVRTYAGQEDVSRQLLERGTPGIDRLIYADLVAAYARALDADLINGAGTGGTHKGVLNATGTNAVTYTDTTPTVAELYPKLADAIQQVAANRKLAATVIVMHPRRWGWFIAALDAANRPLVVPDPGAAFNALGTGAAGFGEGQLVGTLAGLPVVVDANVPTNLGSGSNEDRIIVMRASDPILWEEGDGLPRELRFDDVGSGTLTVRLTVYGYSAFTAERYATGVSVISGSGLATPTF